LAVCLASDAKMFLMRDKGNPILPNLIGALNGRQFL